MFKVEFFVEDKKLPDSLRALTGLIRGLPSVVPVANVEEKHPSGLQAKNGSVLEAFGHHIARLDRFSPDDVRAFLKGIGRAEGSASYLAQKAVAARMIKRSGKGNATQYHVVKRLTHHKEG